MTATRTSTERRKTATIRLGLITMGHRSRREIEMSGVYDVYHSPEKFGLTVVDEIELDNESYRFNIRMIWRHEDGTLYTARDSGCSCPSPFEDYTELEGLERIATRQQVDEIIKEAHDSSASHEEKDSLAEKLDAAWKASRKRKAKR